MVLIRLLLGTNIELWSSKAALKQCPFSQADQGGKGPGQPNWSALWEGMVAPLTRMSVAGWIWYQGPSPCSPAFLRVAEL